ncbi:MAG TPA: hypothetical protein DCM86_11535 [Verrucomicrobiales bacterium]|nr:hypothetical protein [Verrucomicrobiales bacterium]
MRTKDPSAVVLTAMTILFAVTATALWRDVWGHPAAPSSAPLLDAQFTNTATLRMSAAELIRTGGDTSGLTCGSCHDEKKKPVSVHFNADGTIRLPEEHKDLVMQHGRNNHCFNCHDPSNLELLKTRDGTTLKVEEGTKLCGSCHGPTLRDWEAGIHGRATGFWDPRAGARVKADCTSCHDAHSPAFPPIKAAPGPNLFRASLAGAREGAH